MVPASLEYSAVKSFEVCDGAPVSYLHILATCRADAFRFVLYFDLCHSRLPPCGTLVPLSRDCRGTGHTTPFRGCPVPLSRQLFS